MFDVAFSELMVIAVVALIVIGPEKLPKVARALGLLMGRFQKTLHSFKTDLAQNNDFHHLKNDWQALQHDFSHTAQDLKNTLQNSLENSLENPPHSPSDFCGPLPPSSPNNER